MKIKKSLAALTATVSIMALATGCSSSGSSGVVDTQADKGLAVMGDTITYDPNHLVNDGQPIELGYWSWGDESTDPVIQAVNPDVKKIGLLSKPPDANRRAEEHAIT